MNINSSGIGFGKVILIQNKRSSQDAQDLAENIGKNLQENLAQECNFLDQKGYDVCLRPVRSERTTGSSSEERKLGRTDQNFITEIYARKKTGDKSTAATRTILTWEMGYSQNQIKKPLHGIIKEVRKKEGLTGLRALS